MSQEENKRLEKIEHALFGDEQVGEIGMVKKMDEVWGLLIGISFIGKMATWLAVVAAGVGAAWGVITHFFKSATK